jgi:SAM-dependent methyltransferase
MTSHGYVHGYTNDEAVRLADQAGTLAELLHHDTQYPTGSRVLEAGCGVGAQTRILARRSPGAHFVSVDLSAQSLALARATIVSDGVANVELREANLFALPFADAKRVVHSVTPSSRPWRERPAFMMKGAPRDLFTLPLRCHASVVCLCGHTRAG